MSAETQPNTKHVSVPMPVPRDPSEYRTTMHFGQRLRERVPAPIRDRVVRECIQSGTVRGACPPGSSDGVDDMVQAFSFTREVDGRDWVVVVGIILEAYRSDSVKHKAITVYPGDGDD